jgi:hypothetical protein
VAPTTCLAYCQLGYGLLLSTRDWLFGASDVSASGVTMTVVTAPCRHVCFAGDAAVAAWVWRSVVARGACLGAIR